MQSPHAHADDILIQGPFQTITTTPAAKQSETPASRKTVRMTTILAIDPGPRESAFVNLLDNGEIELHGKRNNLYVRNLLERNTANQHLLFPSSTVAIEMIASYGMPVSAEVFETCLHIGRFLEIAPSAICCYRMNVKMFLCGNSKANDSTIRTAIIDRYRQPDGKNPIKKGGPLYGISGDCWSALAVALTVQHARSTLKTFTELGIT